MDFPQLIVPTRDVLSSYSIGNSIGAELVGTADLGPTAATWPSANRAIFVPFVVGEIWVVKQMGLQVSTASGNCDVGIYDQSGNRIINKGSTAMAGTATTQIFDITDTTLLPGRYYMAAAVDNTTAKNGGASPAVGICSAMGILQMATAFALPATATFAACSSAYVPNISLFGRSAAAG